MAWLLGQTLILLIVAFLIGAFIGYFLKNALAGNRKLGNKSVGKADKKDVRTQSLAPAFIEEGPQSSLAARLENRAVAITIDEEKKQAAAKADWVGKRPQVLAAPIGERADNLKRIKGIGPKNEENLNQIGIYHFSQIASWSAQEARWIGTFLAFPGRIEREEWMKQAEILAGGGETDFSKRVDLGEVESSQSTA